MPFSSAEIAQSINAFQGQSMNNQAYSQMIGMGNMGAHADRIGGGLMSRGAGIAGPLASAGLGLMGLDPMSLGMRAGTAAWGGGAGILGAGAAGLGVAGLAAGGFAAAGYAGNQIMAGAQQQGQLNNALRGNFNFLNGNGGQGFSRGDMAQIGGSMRSMTHQLGPEGQMTSFGELTNLASNMGKMGMTTGVRDAQEFSRKFKEMVTTLKTVAHTLGTSLEEAQQFVSAQRSSGMFRAADQLKFANTARSTSFSGGLALSEVTGMASIGSQISRSVGGLGRQGAFGGMKAIGQIGSALQTGAISEEDVYNATGLTGAEGRQAMASNMMAQGASFMKSGRGRHFLASMAGKDGSLDEESVQNWMNGTMDVGSTKSQGSKNLGKVGRANFIRNEGRLRGAALERFGGLAPTMAYQQWLSGRGADPSNMDDRSMLAFQRFSGMGRDEADAAIQMVQKLPEMLQQQRQSGMDDKDMQRMSSYRQTHGIEGMKRKLEHMKEGLNGKLQKVGQDMYTSTSDLVERWFNRAMGITEQHVSENVNELWQAAKMGGKGGAEMMNRLSAKGLSGFSAIGSGSGQDLQGFTRSQRMRTAAELGGSGTTSEISDFAKSSRGWMREAYTAKDGLGSMNGEARMQGFQKLLEQKAKGGDASAAAMLKTWGSSNETQRAGLLASAENQVGISEKARLGKSWQDDPLAMRKGLFATEREGDISMGRSVLGRSEGTTSGILDYVGKAAVMSNPLAHGLAVGYGAARSVAKLFGKDIGPDAMSMLKCGGNAVSDLLKGVRGTLSGDDNYNEGAMKYMRSKEGGGAIYGALIGGEKGREALQNQVQELSGQKELSDHEKGKLELMRQSLVASRFREFDDATKNMGQGGLGAETEKMKAYAKSVMGRDVSLEEAKGMYQRVGGALVGLARENQGKIIDREIQENLGKEKTFQSVGLGSIGADGKLNLTKSTADRLSKEVGKKGSDAAKYALASMNATSGLSTADPDSNTDRLNDIQKNSGNLFDTISDMSTAEKTKFARVMAGSGVGSQAGESLMREKRLKSAMGRGKGAVGGIASLLGVDLSKDEIQNLKGQNASEVAEFLSSKKGIKDDKFKGVLSESIEAAKAGKIGKGADILGRGIEQSDEAKKKMESKKDPQTEIAEAIKQSNNYLKALVVSNTGAKAALDAIAASTAEAAANGAGGGNAENKGDSGKANRPR